MFLQGYLRGLDAAEDELFWQITRKSKELTDNALTLHHLEGKDYERQENRISYLKSELQRLEDKLHDIKRLPRQYGWKVR